MRLIILIFFILFSCANPIASSKKIYICGDHTCKNNKEVEEYFSNNISVEVFTIDTSRTDNENFDLVELNMLEDKLKSNFNKRRSIIAKKESEIKQQVQKRQKVAKLNIKKVDEPTQTIKKIKTKIEPKKKKKSKVTFIRICKNLEECDIDKISKLIMDIGKEKDFPDISAK